MIQPLEIALNHHCGIPAVAYALAVVGPDGQVGTYVSDNVKIAPKRLFSTAFRGQLLRASGSKPGKLSSQFPDLPILMPSLPQDQRQIAQMTIRMPRRTVLSKVHIVVQATESVHVHASPNQQFR